MRKPTKQDLIFIGKIVLYILATFIIYIIIRVYFVDTCDIPQEGPAGYIGNSVLNIRYTEVCFGSGGFFDKYSHYLYILFLWITIVPFIQKKYLLSKSKLFITGLITLIGIAGIVIGMLILLYSL